MPNLHVPAYLRHSLVSARRPHVGYRSAGYNLALHLEEHADEEGADKLDALLTRATFTTADELWKWIQTELPGCASAVPRRRRESFMAGVMEALEEGRI